jgi:hypothetical protein
MKGDAAGLARSVPGHYISSPMKPQALLALLLALACRTGRDDADLRDGDIVFQTSRSAQSSAIQLATHSRYSHMGMIVRREGKPFVFEASATVRYTPFDAFVARGDGRHFVVKRLRNAADQLTPKVFQKARAMLPTLAGKRYDLAFEWSDERMYCSELVWKIYERVLGVRLGELQRLRELDLDQPAVAAKLRERYGRDVPLDEPVISPAAIYASPLLQVVLER